MWTSFKNVGTRLKLASIKTLALSIFLYIYMATVLMVGNPVVCLAFTDINLINQARFCTLHFREHPGQPHQSAILF